MNEQEHYAAVYSELSRRLLRAAYYHTQYAGPVLTPFDVAKIYMAAGTWLAKNAASLDVAVALLREVADQFEAGADLTRPG